MPLYHLQATMQFTDGRDGVAIDTINIEAADVVSVIALAREWRPSSSGLVADVLMLISPEGTALWSLRRMGEP